MKILFINNGAGIRKGLSGGTERLLQLCSALVQGGHRIQVVTASGDRDFFHELGLGSHIHINPNPLAALSDNKITRSLWYVFSAFSSMAYFRKARVADIVYAPSDYICDVVPAVFLSWLARKPLAAFIHHECRPPSQRKGLYLINLLSYLAQGFSFALLRTFAAKIFFYDTPEGHRIATRFAGKNTAFGLNGIDPVFHQPCAPLTSHTALFAGGLRPSKGIDELIDVWAMVVKKVPDAVLRVAGGGDGAYTDHVKQRIRDLGIEKNFVLLGVLDKKVLCQEYARAAMYVACSHEEGWGISIYQALASGHEVFALNLPCFERVRAYAHFYEAHQLDEMAQQIAGCFMGTAAGKSFAFAAQEFYWKNVLQHDIQSLAELTS